MTSILYLDKNGERIEDYIFSSKFSEVCMYKNKYIDKDKKLFVMPKDYYLTKKKSDENNITEWDNYDYILIPSDSDRNEEEWNKNKKGELEILRGDGGCPFTCHTSKQNCPSGDGYCGYSAKDARCTCHSHASGQACISDADCDQKDYTCQCQQSRSWWPCGGCLVCCSTNCTCQHNSLLGTAVRDQ